MAVEIEGRIGVPVKQGLSGTNGGKLPSRNSFIDPLFVLLVPFIQLGFSYYAAVATISAVILVYRARSSYKAGIIDGGMWIFCAPAMFLSLIERSNGDLTQDLLRIARESICFAVLLLVVRGSAVRPAPVNWSRLIRLMIAVSATWLILCLGQLLALRGGRYIGIPAAFFSQGANTIPTELALLYSSLRPSATFSEPSYLAFILLSFLLPVAALTGRKTYLIVLTLFSVGCGLVSQSAGFVLFGGLLLLTVIVLRAPYRWRVILLPLIVAVAALIMVFASDLTVLSRVSSGAQASGDVSIFVRIFGPLRILPAYLIEHPLGLPFSSLEAVLRPYTSAFGIDPLQYLMNGLFNLFFEFGVVGLPMLLGLLLVRDGVVRVYLLAVMMFNGAFLAPDKLAVVGFSISVYFALRRTTLSAKSSQYKRAQWQQSSLSETFNALSAGAAAPKTLGGAR